MGIFSSIKAGYNYFRPTKSSSDYFGAAKESALSAVSAIKDAGVKIANGLPHLLTVAKNVALGVVFYDFVVGKAAAIKGSNDLVEAVTGVKIAPTKAKQFLDWLYPLLTKVPKDAVAASIVATLLSDPKALLGMVKDFGLAAIDTLKAAYHAVDVGVNVLEGGIAGLCEIMDSVTGNTSKEDSSDLTKEDSSALLVAECLFDVDLS